MKKIKYLIMVIMSTLLLSGCVRVEGTVEVKKNGKVDSNFLIAVMDYNKLYEKSESKNSEEEKRKLIDSAITPEMVTEIEDAGWTVEDYEDGSYLGYEINKKNMPLTEAGDSISELTDILKESPLMADDAEIKQQSLGGKTSDEQVKAYMEGLNIILDVELFDEEENTKDIDKLLKYISMFDGSAKFILKLPVSGAKSNATSVTDKGKTLEWDFVELEDNNVHIEYNLLIPLIIVGVIFILLIVIIVVIIVVVRKKRKKKRAQNNENKCE